MRSVGIICEYNPFHLGHQRQFQMIRQQYGDECAIVCLMSGNYVQRGAPAIFDKSIRAKAAILSGADLVLELPIGVALSSAEGFAAGGIQILSKCCDVISFGTESMDSQALMQTARALLQENFMALLKSELSFGCSFPAARQAVLRKLGITEALNTPNDILGVEYCKAILQQGLSTEVFPVHRDGDYHSAEIDTHSPSATAVRCRILSGDAWNESVPKEVFPLFDSAACHSIEAAERAILSRLRTMTEEEFASLPYGSEGLWRKLMKASRVNADLSSIIEATKSKRYTRTRIDRMILCAFLGLTVDDMGITSEPVRTLAFTNRGRTILKEHPVFLNAGEQVTDCERRIGDLYGLFCTSTPEAPGIEDRRRIFYHNI